MGKERAYSAKPSITSGDHCRASLPGLALLLGMGAGGGPWGPQATGLMPAALGRKPHKPSGQIPCQHSMESSSETCTCRHRPALHPVAFPIIFKRILCWSCHRLQWRKRCSRVWAVVLSPPPHHQHLSSSRCPNRFRYMPTGVGRRLSSSGSLSRFPECSSQYKVGVFHPVLVWRHFLGVRAGIRLVPL